MEIETVLIKLILIICGAFIIGTLIYGVNLLPAYKFIKKTLSILLVIFFAVWIVDLFKGPDFVSNLILNWVKHLLA
jgi:membrane protein YdbS with pleckstrin-like domain